MGLPVVLRNAPLKSLTLYKNKPNAYDKYARILPALGFMLAKAARKYLFDISLGV